MTLENQHVQQEIHLQMVYAAASHVCFRGGVYYIYITIFIVIIII